MKILVFKFYGIILIVGLIGVGKSIIFYVVLMGINVSEWNIMIVEDFIEFDIDGIL